MNPTLFSLEVTGPIPFLMTFFEVGFDLCVLASSDHSVHAYGTFGLWGSLLAGGDVIVSKGRSRTRLSEEDYIYREAAMPGWLYIDTRQSCPLIYLLRLNA